MCDMRKLSNEAINRQWQQIWRITTKLTLIGRSEWDWKDLWNTGEENKDFGLYILNLESLTILYCKSSDINKNRCQLDSHFPLVWYFKCVWTARDKNTFFTEIHLWRSLRYCRLLYMASVPRYLQSDTNCLQSTLQDKERIKSLSWSRVTKFIQDTRLGPTLKCVLSN